MKKTELIDTFDEVVFDSDQDESDYLLYYSKQTDAFVWLNREVLDDVENTEEDEEFSFLYGDEEDYEMAKVVAFGGDDQFISFPTYLDNPEFRWMHDFANKQHDADLISAIQGRQAYRNFRDVITRKNMQDAWYDYRYEALTQLALEWAAENNIKIDET